MRLIRWFAPTLPGNACRLIACDFFFFFGDEDVVGDGAACAEREGVTGLG